MTPFKIKLDSKESIFDQIVFAATKAILSGAMKLDDAFPSVRALAVDLKIHPNTAHKVVQYLIQERWLNTRPGKGTTVALPPKWCSNLRHLPINNTIATTGGRNGSSAANLYSRARDEEHGQIPGTDRRESSGNRDRVHPEVHFGKRSAEQDNSDDLGVLDCLVRQSTAT